MKFRKWQKEIIRRKYFATISPWEFYLPFTCQGNMKGEKNSMKFEECSNLHAQPKTQWCRWQSAQVKWWISNSSDSLASTLKITSGYWREAARNVKQVTPNKLQRNNQNIGHWQLKEHFWKMPFLSVLQLYLIIIPKWY